MPTESFRFCRLPLAVLAFVLSSVSVPSVALSDEATATELFESKIRPVLVEVCFKCHGDNTPDIDFIPRVVPNTNTREAFDISLEPAEVREAYDTGRFGRGCLLARRLVENGARYVEVTTEYVPFLHWDTHERGHETVARMHAEIDRPIATLVRDLEARGLLDRTLVVVASEFRDRKSTRLNSSHVSESRMPSSA